MNSALIHFFEVESWEKEMIQHNFPENSFMLWEGHLKDVPLSELQSCEILSCFVFSSIDADLIRQLPQLKMIATRSTGFDHIDLEACRKRNIRVANVPLYGERTVAEHTFALMLALTRKIVPSVERTRSGSFSLEGLRGMDLYGKTLGVIGTGNIGRHVIEIAFGFGMKILAYDLQHDTKIMQKWKVQYVSLPELLQQSDILSLHLPYQESTHHFINLQNLSLIKKGAILINTSRGGVIQTEALILGLSEGIFGGIGLDVLESEPAIREERELLSTVFQGNLKSITTLLANEYLLHSHKNVIVTPHNAFNTKEALERILRTTIENICEFQKGKLVNII